MSIPQPFSDLPHVAEATYLRATYTDGLLKIHLDHDDLGPIELHIPTRGVLFTPSEHLPLEDHTRQGTRLEVHRATQYVAVQNGHFVPPTGFSLLMNDTRSGRHLCYGQKATPNLHLVTLVGYVRWVTCLCLDPAAITWQHLAD